MARIALSLAVTAALACVREAPRTAATLHAPHLGVHAAGDALRDGFDLGVSRGAPVGLDRDLAARQAGPLAPVTWSRVPGVWFDAPPPDASMSDLRRAPGGDGDALYLHGNTAVRLDHAFALAPSGITVRARLDPVAGDVTGQSWVSVVLTREPETRGWVTGRDAAPGLLVRSNGQVTLFHRTREQPIAWDGEALTAAPSYALTLTLARAAPDGAGAAWVLRGEINARRFHVALEEAAATPLPARVWLVFGAHFHPGEARENWIDDVAVSTSP